MIVALLAVLEMVRMQAILLVQSELFADIRLRKHRMAFDAVFRRSRRDVANRGAIPG